MTLLSNMARVIIDCSTNSSDCSSSYSSNNNFMSEQISRADGGHISKARIHPETVKFSLRVAEAGGRASFRGS